MDDVKVYDTVRFHYAPGGHATAVGIVVGFEVDGRARITSRTGFPPVWRNDPSKVLRIRPDLIVDLVERHEVVQVAAVLG